MKTQLQARLNLPRRKRLLRICSSNTVKSALLMASLELSKASIGGRNSSGLSSVVRWQLYFVGKVGG